MFGNGAGSSPLQSVNSSFGALTTMDPHEITIEDEIASKDLPKAKFQGGTLNRVYCISHKPHGDGGKTIRLLYAEGVWVEFDGKKLHLEVPQNDPELSAMMHRCYGKDCKSHFFTVGLVMPTNARGDITNGDPRFVAFDLPPAKWDIFKQINSQFPLVSHDLLIRVSNDADAMLFNKWAISACNETVMDRLPPAARQELMARAEEAWTSLLWYLPKAKSREEIIAIMSGNRTIAGGQALGPLNDTNPFVGTQTAGPANTPKAASFSDLVAESTQTNGPAVPWRSAGALSQAHV